MESEERSEFDDFLEEQGIKEEVEIMARDKIINQLEADKLEAYRAIVDNHTAEWCGSGYCVHCEEFHSSGHEKDCIVLKAEKYIGEVEG